MADEQTQSEEKKEEKKQKVKPQEDIKTEEPKVEQKTKDEAEEVEVPDKFRNLVEEIEKMSVLDLAELVKILEKKFGVSSVVPVVAVGAAPVGAAGGGEEKTEFIVELSAVGDNKIGVIKVVREVTEKGLKDAKDLVDSAPQVIKEGVKKEDAEEIKKKIEEAGGQVTLK